MSYMSPMVYTLYFLSVVDTSDVIGSGVLTDPKQLRKLRQQQLQQKFRKEMEAKRLQQGCDQNKSEDTEVAIGQGSSGGKSFMCYSILLRGFNGFF